MPPPTSRYRENSASREAFRPDDRIRRRSDYLRLQEQGRRVHTAHFVMLVLPCREGSRLGITVSKRICGAVQRNRIRRVAREVFRRNRGIFPESCDLVMIARSGAEEIGYHGVRDEIDRASAALRRALRTGVKQDDDLSSPELVIRK